MAENKIQKNLIDSTRRRGDNTPVYVAEAAEQVYNGYAVLDLAANKKNMIDGISFKEYVKQQIAANPEKSSIATAFSLNNKQYKLHLEKKEDSWSVQIERINQPQHQFGAFKPKPMSQYTSDDFFDLINVQKLKLHTKDDSFSTNIRSVDGETVQIGGPGKLELWSLHLNNLYLIYQNLISKNPDNHQLIAMTTGSGKSYTQALWFLILYLSGNGCIFAVPREDLVDQLKRDFARLLPNEIVNQIKDIPYNGLDRPYNRYHDKNT
ncbi:MAG TPA: DEAD/DEAH box helicase family protein, partial [Legionellaceae bacterium]|nr:DEAD/DEAH box helicase family protein [Legionellaceae bacterium]